MQADTAISRSGGITTHMLTDGGKTHVVREAVDHQLFLDYTADTRAAERDHGPKDDEFRRVASIPVAVQYEWLTKHGVNFWDEDHWPAVMRLLRSPDYRYLATTQKIII